MPSPSSRQFPFRRHVIAGLVLLILPTALLLFADDQPAPAVPVSAKTTTTQPDAAATQAREKAEKAEQEREAKKEEEITRVMKFFQETQPDLFEKAQALRQTDPKRFENLVHGASGTVNRLEALRTKNKDLFDLTLSELKLKYQSKLLAFHLKKPDLSAADREHDTAELNKVAGEDFEVRQRIRQAEIEDLKNQLNQLDAKLQSDEKVKETLIQNHVKKLIENPSADW